MPSIIVYYSVLQLPVLLGGRVGGQPDRHDDIIVAFGNFANALDDDYNNNNNRTGTSRSGV
jgi:hypothetical protein